MKRLSFRVCSCEKATSRFERKEISCRRGVVAHYFMKQLFEDDPMEYVTQDIEGSDLDTRRRSAKELVKGLRKSYEQQVTQIFGNHIQTLLGS